MPRFVAAVLRTHKPDPALSVLGTAFSAILNGEGSSEEQLLKSVKAKRLDKVKAALQADAVKDLLAAGTKTALRGLSLPAGAGALVVNGRLYGPVDPSLGLSATDVLVLEQHLLEQGQSRRLVELLQQAELTGVDADNDTPALRSSIISNVATVRCSAAAALCFLRATDSPHPAFF